MHAARWTKPIAVAAVIVATSGSLMMTARAAGAAGRQAASAAVMRMAAISTAPLVRDGARLPAAKRGLSAPPVTQAMRRADAIKQAEARRYLRHAQTPAAKDVAATQRAQIRDYFCGPATVTEMLAQMHIGLRQLAAAKELRTTPAGTDWSNARGYPLPRVLNAHQKLTTYVAVGLPWSPTAAQVAAFRTDLVRDLNRGRGVPIAGAAYEVPGGPHLVGHPPGSSIRHWFDIRGYSSNGAVTDYEDSVHGASSIGWAAGVPAYSSLPSATIVYILGARGYIW